MSATSVLFFETEVVDIEFRTASCSSTGVKRAAAALLVTVFPSRCHAAILSRDFSICRHKAFLPRLLSSFRYILAVSLMGDLAVGGISALAQNGDGTHPLEEAVDETFGYDRPTAQERRVSTVSATASLFKICVRELKKMKKLKSIFSCVLSLAIIGAVSMTAFAETPKKPENGTYLCS